MISNNAHTDWLEKLAEIPALPTLDSVGRLVGRSKAGA